MTEDYVARAENLHKTLNVGQMEVKAIQGITLGIARGEMLGIIGPSGSGKSTLMGLLGGLDTPTSGSVIIDGTDITNLSERALTRIRNEKIGFVFQSFNLIATLSALENVALPVQFSTKKKFSPRERARELLQTMGLAEREHHQPNQLSGGQQQRVAIARAMANAPALLLCDEPTGNLDTEASANVLETLRAVRDDFGATVVIVTHDMAVANQLDRLITLVDGRVADDSSVADDGRVAQVAHPTTAQ